MSRIRIPLEEPGSYLLVGYDVPFQTYFAMLYTKQMDTRRLEDEPDKAVGYHPMERGSREITEHGPYPCDLPTLGQYLREWGLTPTEVKVAVESAGLDGPE